MTPTPCPVCGEPGGFHADGPHRARLVPPERLYVREVGTDGKIRWYRLSDGAPLPADSSAPPRWSGAALAP